MLQLKNHLFAIGLISLVSGSAFAKGDHDTPFRAIFIDKKTENKLGSFPFDRGLYAQALSRLRDLGVKGVVIKYFLDQPKSGSGDDLLVQEILKVPTLLQARMDPSEVTPNPLPNRFFMAGVEGSYQEALGSSSGWLPLEKFSRHCQGLGFVDLADANVPLSYPIIETYQNKPVNSLVLATVAFALGKAPKVVGGSHLMLNGKRVPLSQNSEVTVTLPSLDELRPISFLDLLEKKVDASDLKGKVVILGYEGELGGRFKTPLGVLSAHRLFFYSIQDFYRRTQ